MKIVINHKDTTRIMELLSPCPEISQISVCLGTIKVKHDDGYYLRFDVISDFKEKYHPIDCENVIYGDVIIDGELYSQMFTFDFDGEIVRIRNMDNSEFEVGEIQFRNFTKIYLNKILQ